MRTWVSSALTTAFLLVALLPSRADWSQELARMPLPINSTLTRAVFIPLCLKSFRSNELVKAMIFLPGVPDDFYLINRDNSDLQIRANNLLQAMSALTNQTRIRVTFERPFLLLSGPRDRSRPTISIKNSRNESKLKISQTFPCLICADRHWDRLQPLLQENMGIAISPKASSSDAWHFARFNLSAYGLTDWELLSALSLGGKTKVTVERKRIRFEEIGEERRH